MTDHHHTDSALDVFDLPERRAAKGVPHLIDRDRAQFAALAACLQEQADELAQRLAEEKRSNARGGQEALERDQAVHRLGAQLRRWRRYGVDVCLGRMTPDDGSPPVYVGRFGVRDAAGRPLVIDWRSPAAEPFFAATLARPMGLAARRRYHWTRGRITDYVDEAFTARGLADGAALDDRSAFIAGLAGPRSHRMRDVLSTIQADQDAIIRASSRGALVVDGGPGTGKTVVALHRTAYLLYADPRLGHRRRGVLFVGPHEPYLRYVSDVLPSLGEEGVLTCTLRDLVPEGADAVEEPDPEVAALKSTVAMVEAVDAAVAFHEQPPAASLIVETDWADVEVTRADWAEAFAAPEPGTPHNEARDRIHDELVRLLVERHTAPGGGLDGGLDSEAAGRFGAALLGNRHLRSALFRAWPLVEPGDLVADLWSVPAYLRLCAPWLTSAQVRSLQRADPHAWTVADLPLLDAARRRLGNTQASAAAEARRRTDAARTASMDQVVADLIASDDSELLVMSMLRGEDLRDALIDPDASARIESDPYAGPFAHVVVDEAQELTDAQWQMILQRCPSRSLTIVGDRAQARHGFPESWQQRLRRIGLSEVDLATLSINYRTPAEVMTAAEPVIRAVLPDANVPVSVRSNGIGVRHGRVDDLGAVLTGWLAAEPDGIGCVIVEPGSAVGGEALRARIPSDRIQVLDPSTAKGLEFDLVVIIASRVPPGTGADALARGVDRYVAMTRATERLVLLTT